MRYKDGTRELYDMKADPGEFTNLAEKHDFSPRLEQMDKMLQMRLNQVGIQDKNPSTRQRQTKTSQQTPAPSSN